MKREKRFITKEISKEREVSKMKREKGFTLIELVMVIVIIGILAAVALPRFANLRKDAQQSACKGNTGAVRGALAAYYAKTAVTPSWVTTENASGYPPSLTQATFLACFITGGALPNCPLTGSTTPYTNNYTSATGVINEHTH